MPQAQLNAPKIIFASSKLVNSVQFYFNKLYSLAMLIAKNEKTSL